MGTQRHRPSVEATTQAAIESARACGVITRPPVAAEVLKRTKKSQVVRMRPERGPAVIAKHGYAGTHANERLVYEHVLPAVPARSLYPLAWGGADPHDPWLFLEDAGDVDYDKSEPEDRRSVGRLLGVMVDATSSINLPSAFQHHGLPYYLSVLVEGRERLATYSSGLDIDPVVGQTLERLDSIESRWGDLEAVHLDGPTALCHADVIPRNVRFLHEAGKRYPVLLDWELAGTGPPAIDLGTHGASGPDDPFVLGFVEGAGLPGEPERVLHWIAVGRIMRLLHAVLWASMDLPTSSVARGVRNLGSYVRIMDGVLVDLGAQKSGVVDG
jgi:hypothetical protein